MVFPLRLCLNGLRFNDWNDLWRKESTSIALRRYEPVEAIVWNDKPQAVVLKDALG